jgi:hypothetical protein
MKGVTACFVVVTVVLAMLAPQVLHAQQGKKIQVVAKPPAPQTVAPPSLVDPDMTAWKVHIPNPRFLVYGTETEELRDDLVLDRETGLLWVRDQTRGTGLPTFGFEFAFPNAVDKALNVVLQGRKGFRLPTVDELASLLYFATGPGDRLPPGHPFVAVKTGDDDWYWSCTPDLSREGNVFCVNFARGEIASKALRDAQGHYTSPHYHYLWPVRIGRGVLAEVE